MSIKRRLDRIEKRPHSPAVYEVWYHAYGKFVRRDMDIDSALDEAGFREHTRRNPNACRIIVSHEESPPANIRGIKEYAGFEPDKV